jgi:hypothetical protein
VQIEEAHAQATHMAARTDDAGVFRAIGLRVLTQVEQNAGLMRLLLCSAFKVDAFAALEGHALAHILFESKVHRLHAFPSGYIETRIADGVVRPLNPVIVAQGFVGMIVDSLLLHEIHGIPRPADYSLEQAVETFVTLFCNGIRP